MEQFETRFSQVDVFMDELDLFNLFKRYVSAAPDCLSIYLRMSLGLLFITPCSSEKAAWSQ